MPPLTAAGPSSTVKMASIVSPVLEVDNSLSVTPGLYGHHAKTLHSGENGYPGFTCPANIDPALAEYLCDLAIQGHKAIGAVDISRGRYSFGC